MAPGSSPAVAYRPAHDRPPRRPAEVLLRACFLTMCADLDHGSSIEQLLTARYGDDNATRAFLHGVERAASVPAATTTGVWGAALAGSAVADFIATLGESAGARLIEAGIALDLGGVNTVTIPARATAPSTGLGFIAQGAPIPVVQRSFTPVTLGPPGKIAAAVTMTSELARSSNGEAVMGTLLREDAAASLDSALFSTTAGEPSHPGGLLAGVAALTATAGGGDAAMLADLDQLAAAVSASGATSVAYIAATRQALAANLRLGRLGSTVSIWPSRALAAGTVIAVAPQAFVSGFVPTAQIERSPDGALVMADPAAEFVTGAGAVASPVRSLWQTDTVGIRAILRCAWALRATGAVAWLQSATWG